jgi:hypothetical protein
MAGVGGVEAARRLRALRPTLPIALQQCAAGLGLLLFDKADFDRLLPRVGRQAMELAAGGDADPAPLDRCGWLRRGQPRQQRSPASRGRP